ncbi:hypothetical protein MY8738_007152 [Beauveria namnaoensis]
MPPSLAQRRLAWAEDALALRPEVRHWREVIFSDEKHFGYGSEGRAYIARKPGTRDQPGHLQERKELTEKDQKRLHAWAAVGYDFKSPLIWYEVPGNTNGKMSQKVYRDVILEGYVKGLIRESKQQNRSFILKEDGDSGHGPGRHNLVRAWKEEHKLRYFFNCPQSPNLSPIENCWVVIMEVVRQQPHWDKEILRELAEEGWAALT